jgi:hypothetical protein
VYVGSGGSGVYVGKGACVGISLGALVAVITTTMAVWVGSGDAATGCCVAAGGALQAARSRARIMIRMRFIFLSFERLQFYSF